MKHDIPTWRRVPPPNQWLSAYWHPPQVGQYQVRKFSVEENCWMEATAYYFGGSDMRWRLLKFKDNRWCNAGPLSIDGLEYHARTQ